MAGRVRKFFKRLCIALLVLIPCAWLTISIVIKRCVAEPPSLPCSPTFLPVVPFSALAAAAAPTPSNTGSNSGFALALPPTCVIILTLVFPVVKRGRSRNSLHHSSKRLSLLCV